jgi:3-hydroxyacyl-CoA dehydrogenase / enoyl-CoA hydratase / 3-hydroxybutyryl-CoA epimerase
MQPMRMTIEREDRDGVAVLALASPGRDVNVVDEDMLASLRVRLDEVTADGDVRAVVLTSARPNGLGVGADVAWLPDLAARPDAEDFLAGVADLMLDMVACPKPIVAAVHGTALGGAFELALGAHELLLGASAVVGLPEVGLQLMPGGGGTQLVARFVTPEVAAELLTSGRRVTADEALALGLAARVVPDAELLDAAVARATALADGGRRVEDPSEPLDRTGAGQDAVAARRGALASGRGGLTRAAAAILDVLAVGLREGLRSGLDAERAGFLGLLRSAEARAAVHLFLAEAEVRRRSRGSGPEVERLGVVGAGQMGAGITATAVSRGLRAVVRDQDEAALARAAEVRDGVLARRAPAGGADAGVQAWSATTAWDGFDAVDAVVEAVFELPEVKHAVLADVSAQVPPTALIGTNTSAIPIASLAPSVVAPERFLGMHFFSPVDRMPLVELIPHAGTAPGTVERAAALGRALGKVPVVVGDAPGFYTSRVYARWLIEGVRLLLDGYGVEDVDRAARAAGFPVGPLQAFDEATVLLVLQASIAQVAEHAMAERVDVTAIRTALETLHAAGIEGRRQGRGFYRYEDGRRTGADPDVLGLLGITPRAADGVDTAHLGERLLLAFASECLLCWDDGTLCHPVDGDVAAVLGIGFPRLLGGPFGWVDELGAAELVRRCEALDARAFDPGARTRALAAAGRRFVDEPRRPAPFAALPEVGA